MAIAWEPPVYKTAKDDTDVNAPRGIEVVEHAGYPELHVDGAPFFIHSAEFFYYRTPRDQWEPLLQRYLMSGINTIDIYIPWNWHEPKEGDFDFDGHTNPRRDLRALLALIVEKHLRLIARPGPEILNEWRQGGYPGWLLERPEYNMSHIDWLEGRYPPLDGLNAQDAEAAARGWLDNATHMAQTREWFAAVGKELAPYSSHRVVHSASDNPDTPPRESSGPLLFVQLGDDFAIGRTNRAGSDFWRYVEDLRGMLEAAGVDVPVFINPTDMRVSAAGSMLPQPIGVMGQWYMPSRAEMGPEGRRINAGDADEIEFYAEELETQPAFPPVMIEYQAGWYAPAEELETQPAFPPVMIEYQAGWYAPADDDRPPASPPENTLLSSRLLIGNGIHGLNYFPLQDTYTPAGYSVPWANRSYRWGAALDPNGDPQPRLQAVQRNSQLLQLWGPQLAASHKRVDFGIVYPLGAFSQDILSAQDVLKVSESVRRLARLGALAMLSSTLRDPEYQPLEQLLNDPLLFLPVFDADNPQLQLSEHAQEEIVEYVRRGGTLLIFPARPAGKILGQLWKEEAASSAPAEGSAIRARRKFGEGEVIESTKDFLSWIQLDRGLSENRAQEEFGWATGALREFLSAARVRPAVELSGDPKGTSDVVATEIVTNEGTGLLGERESGQGFLSVTNLSEDETADADFEALSPAASTQKMHGVYVPVHAVVPPHESLLLPIEDRLCMEAPANVPCDDSVKSASAELIGAHRDGKVLELKFYVPASSQVVLHLAQHPSHVTLESTTIPEAHWVPDHNELQVTIPRGAAPGFLRILRLDLAYVPHVPEIEKPPKPGPNDCEYSVWNALALPVSADTFLKSYPPVVVITPDQPAAVLLSALNRNPKSTQHVDVSVTGPLRGTDSFDIPPGQSTAVKVSLKPSGADAISLPSDADGLLHGAIKLRSGRAQRSMPVDFLQLPEGAISHYRFDFDRDGADEWTLESGDLRLIVSPESGGRAIALTYKPSGANLTTSVGLLRDAFSYAENPPGGNPLRARGRYGLFNRPYAAEWSSIEAATGLKLHYDAPDIFPSGAQIEKSIQFDGASTLQVQYHVVLNQAAGSAAASPDRPQQSFVAINSFPASAAPGEPTHFCWQSSDIRGSSSNGATTSEDVNEHCEDFVPGGKSIEVPDGIRSIQIRTAGRPSVEISWECDGTCARMAIEPKNFSALFRLQFPVLRPGADARYIVRLRAIGIP